MNVSPYYEAAIRTYSAEDKAFFDRATEMLPKRKETTPYHSEAHSVRSLRMAYELAGRPANVLEIGFCLGHSAALWLELGVEHVTSLENSNREETWEAVRIMKEKYRDRFLFARRGVDWISMGAYGKHTLGFVDGDHSVKGVDEDANTMLGFGIENILFDDFYHWGPGTQPAIEKHRLVPLAILGAMCLCRPAYE